MKGESIRKRVSRLEEKRGDIYPMLLMGEDTNPENVERLKQKILARGQTPWFLCVNLGRPPDSKNSEKVK